MFPGYVLVKMIMSDDAWYVIKNVRGVTGFVGSGTKPTPLTDDEVLQLGVEKREIVVNYAVGDTVRITDGPLPPSQALWRLWTWRKIRSAWPFRCLAAKHRSSWSSTRWK